LGMYVLSFTLFAFATDSWMMFAFTIPYCLGGIAGPAIQGLISGQVAPNEQGELQGALTSLISVTSIIDPPLMTNLFAFYTDHRGAVYFPGAPFLLGALLSLVSLLLTIRSLNKNLPATQATPATV